MTLPKRRGYKCHRGPANAIVKARAQSAANHGAQAGAAENACLNVRGRGRRSGDPQPEAAKRTPPPGVPTNTVAGIVGESYGSTESVRPGERTAGGANVGGGADPPGGTVVRSTAALPDFDRRQVSTTSRRRNHDLAADSGLGSGGIHIVGVKVAPVFECTTPRGPLPDMMGTDAVTVPQSAAAALDPQIGPSTPQIGPSTAHSVGMPVSVHTGSNVSNIRLPEGGVRVGAALRQQKRAGRASSAAVLAPAVVEPGRRGPGSSKSSDRQSVPGTIKDVPVLPLPSNRHRVLVGSGPAARTRQAAATGSNHRDAELLLTSRPHLLARAISAANNSTVGALPGGSAQPGKSLLFDNSRVAPHRSSNVDEAAQGGHASVNPRTVAAASHFVESWASLLGRLHSELGENIKHAEEYVESYLRRSAAGGCAVVDALETWAFDHSSDIDFMLRPRPPSIAGPAGLSSSENQLEATKRSFVEGLDITPGWEGESRMCHSESAAKRPRADHGTAAASASAARSTSHGSLVDGADASGLNARSNGNGRATPAAILTLKRWLYEHFDHPYPTSEEKAELSAATGLPIRRVSTWFQNTRSRLWAPLSRGLLADVDLHVAIFGCPPGSSGLGTGIDQSSRSADRQLQKASASCSLRRLHQGRATANGAPLPARPRSSEPGRAKQTR